MIDWFVGVNIASELRHNCQPTNGTMWDMYLGKSRPWNAELPADRSNQCFLDLAMTWHRRTASVREIAIDRVVRAFTIQDTIVDCQMAYQIDSLHIQVALGLPSTVTISLTTLGEACWKACSR